MVPQTHTYIHTHVYKLRDNSITQKLRGSSLNEEHLRGNILATFA